MKSFSTVSQSRFGWKRLRTGLLLLGIGLSGASCLGIAELNERFSGDEEPQAAADLIALGALSQAGGGSPVGGGAVDASGATLVSNDQLLRVTIPPGAMRDQQKFTITRYVAATNAMPGSFIPTTPIYQITPAYRFEKDVRISIKLNQSTIQRMGLEKNKSTGFAITSTTEEDETGVLVGWNGKESTIEGDDLVFTSRTFSIFGGGTPPPGNRAPDIQGAFYYFKPQSLHLPYRLRARVRELDGDSMQIFLITGPVGGTTNMIPMNPDGGNWFRADIPYEAMAAAGIQMQILAIDQHGLSTTLPATSVFQFPADSGNTNYINNYTNDRDGDGYNDAWEVDNGYNPNDGADPSGVPDADGDGIPDVDDTTPNGESNPAIDSLTIVPDEATMDVGEQITFGVSASFGGQPRFVSAVFQTTGSALSGAAVGSLNAASFTADAPGAAAVIATVGAFNANASVTVHDSVAPDPIVDLTANPTGSGTVQLRWTAPGNDGPFGRAAIYDIRRSTGAITDNASCAAAPFAGATTTPKTAGLPEILTLGGHAPATTYYYCVRAADFEGNFSVWNATVSASTPAAPDTTPPANIAGATASATSSSAVQLAWTAVGDDGNTGAALNYEIRRSLNLMNDDSDCDTGTLVANGIPQTAAGTPLTFDVNGLSGNTSYYFCIRAYDDAGNRSSWTQGPLNVQTLRANQSPIVSVNVLAIEMATRTLILDGGASYDPDAAACAANPANYSIQWSVTNSPATSALTTGDIVNANTLNATVVMDVPGLYEFQLLFVDEAGVCGDGPRGAVATARVTAQVADFAPPADLAVVAATALDYDSISIDWTAVGDDGITGDPVRYEIGYSLIPINSDADCNIATTVFDPGITALPGGSMSYELDGLIHNTTYHFCVRAYDEVNNRNSWTLGSVSATTHEAGNGWSAWSAFSACSANCAGGTMTQTRTCDTPADGCNGSNTNTVSCNTQACATQTTAHAFGGDSVARGCPSGYIVTSYSCTPGRNAIEWFDNFGYGLCGPLGRGASYMDTAVDSVLGGVGDTYVWCRMNRGISAVGMPECTAWISYDAGRLVSPHPHWPGTEQWYASSKHLHTMTCTQTP
ncbi:MAG: fibronectin type III [bacterium]|nr:fibronectin type III [bacterium]